MVFQQPLGVVTSCIWPLFTSSFLCLKCRSIVVALTQQCCNTALLSILSLSQSFKQFKKFHIKRVLQRFSLTTLLRRRAFSCLIHPQKAMELCNCRGSHQDSLSGMFPPHCCTSSIFHMCDTTLSQVSHRCLGIYAYI